MKAALLALLVLFVAAPADAQQAEKRKVAFVMTVGSDVSLFDGDGTPSTGAKDAIARQQRRVTQAVPRTDVPFAVHLSGVFCDELTALGTPAARGLLRDIRALAQHRDVAYTNYSEARLHEVAAAQLVDDVSAGKAATDRCIGRTGPGILFARDGAPPDEDAVEVLAELHPLWILTAFASPPPPDGADFHYLPLATTGPRPGAPGIVAPLDDASTYIDDERFEVVRLADLLQDRYGWTAGEFYEPPPITTAQANAVANAETALEVFEGMTTGGNPLRAVFATVVARARGNIRTTAARENAVAMVNAVADIANKVEIDDGSVTFTSRSGDVPVTISNGNEFPVKVKIELLSSKVEFEDSARDVTVAPPGSTETFAAQARSSGTFPITVRLVIRRQGLIDDAVISVRSTAVNISAVVLTVGGALYVAYWLIRRLRRTGFQISAMPPEGGV